MAQAQLKMQPKQTAVSRLPLRAGAFALLVSLAACVTVNVNFPESAVQKATDDYVRELYRAKEKGKTPTGDPSAKPTPAPTSSAVETPKPVSFLTLIPSAHAQEGANLNFRVDTDKALKIRDRLSARLDEVVKLKRDGVLGETNDGNVELHNDAPLKKAKLMAKTGAKAAAEDPIKKAQKLVESENKDRSDLYEEVLSANNIGKGRMKDIRKSFARSFQAESPSGTWVQDPEGVWTQKK